MEIDTKISEIPDSEPERISSAEESSSQQTTSPMKMQIQDTELEGISSEEDKEGSRYEDEEPSQYGSDEAARDQSSESDSHRKSLISDDLDLQSPASLHAESAQRTKSQEHEHQTSPNLQSISGCFDILFSGPFMTTNSILEKELQQQLKAAELTGDHTPYGWSQAFTATYLALQQIELDSELSKTLSEELSQAAEEASNCFDFLKALDANFEFLATVTTRIKQRFGPGEASTFRTVQDIQQTNNISEPFVKQWGEFGHLHRQQFQCLTETKDVILKDYSCTCRYEITFQGVPLVFKGGVAVDFLVDAFVQVSFLTLFI